jgi:putative MFS transporter
VAVASDAARPGWSWLFFFVRPPEGLGPEQWRLLGLLGATLLVNQYDMAILGLALPQIQRGLGVEEAELGGFLAWVRLGFVPALLLAFLADQQGRRRLLLWTLLGFTLSTALTAFARSPAEFATLQFLARAFIMAEEMIAIVVVTEELDARARGFGLGVLAALGALGHGLAAIVFAFVEVLPFGWRALYLVGIVPLLGMAWIRRALRETRRFESERAARPEAGRLARAARPFRELARAYPRRVLALALATAPFAFVVFTALPLVSKTLQEVHGYEPRHVAFLFLSAGLVAPVGMVLAGATADRIGRRRVMIWGTLLNAMAIAFFYRASGPAVVVAWACMMFTFVGLDVLFGALGSELFPTSHRSTASAVRVLVATLAGVLGLRTEGLLFPLVGSHAEAILWMLPIAALTPFVIAFAIPETASRELEEIAPAPPAPPLRAPDPDSSHVQI